MANDNSKDNPLLRKTLVPSNIHDSGVNNSEVEDQFYNPPLDEHHRQGSRISAEKAQQLFRDKVSVGYRKAWADFTEVNGEKDDYLLVIVFDWLGM